MSHITKRDHQLDQHNIFTDIGNFFKNPIYNPLLDIITNTLLTFLLCLVLQYCIKYSYSIRTSLRFIRQQLFDT